MILYMKEPLPVTMKNMILLDDAETGGLVLVSKATYDQALLLWGRFDGNPNNLMRFAQSWGDVWKSVPWILPAMKWVSHNAPEPLNMLAPVLQLLTKNTTITEEDLNPEFIYGLLHSLSQAADLNAIFLIPAEARAKIDIPTSILLSYKASWDDILQPLMAKVVYKHVVIDEDGDDNDEEDAPKRSKKSKKAKEPVPEEDKDDEVDGDDDDDDDDEEEDDDFFADLFKAARQEVQQESAESGTAPTSAPVASQPASQPASVPVQDDSLVADERAAEIAESNAVLNEFDMD